MKTKNEMTMPELKDALVAAWPFARAFEEGYKTNDPELEGMAEDLCEMFEKFYRAAGNFIKDLEGDPLTKHGYIEIAKYCRDWFEKAENLVG